MATAKTFDDAIAAYNTTLNAGRLCREIFKEAGYPVPPRISALLSEEEVQRIIDEAKPSRRINFLPKDEAIFELHPPAAISREKRKYTVAAPSPIEPPAKPDYGPPPPGAHPRWVAMKAVGASPHSLVLATLKAQSAPIPRARVSNIVSDLRKLKDSNAGYNALMKLGVDGLAKDHGDGWTLLAKHLGGVISGDILWIPEDQMTDKDRAYHRREAIIILLQREGKLLTAEISRALKAASWVKAGSNGNFIKSDMAQLEKEEIVRRLEDKRWLLIQQ